MTDEETQDLIDKCFKTAVTFYLLLYDGSDLAKHFEVAISTTKRWATGVAKPHPLQKKQIIQWIQENG